MGDHLCQGVEQERNGQDKGHPYQPLCLGPQAVRLGKVPLAVDIGLQGPMSYVDVQGCLLIVAAIGSDILRVNINRYRSASLATRAW